MSINFRVITVDFIDADKDTCSNGGFQPFYATKYILWVGLNGVTFPILSETRAMISHINFTEY